MEARPRGLEHLLFTGESNGAAIWTVHIVYYTVLVLTIVYVSLVNQTTLSTALDDLHHQHIAIHPVLQRRWSV